MRRWWAVLMGLVLAAPATAVSIVPGVPGGTTLASAQAGTGLSTKGVDTGTGGYELVLTYCVAAGTATVKTQFSLDHGTTWIDVVNSSKALDSAGTVCDSIAIDKPQGVYATNVTAQTGTVTTKAYFAQRQQ